jgi:HSP20 family protein
MEAITMTEAHTDTHAGAASSAGKRNDAVPAAGERRSFREEAEASSRPAHAGGSAAAALEQARRELEQAGARAGHWGPNLMSRQLDPILRMQTDMIHWFDDLWRETAAAWWPGQRLAAMSTAPLFGHPPSEVKETERAYTLSIELPGMAREDLNVTLDGDILVVGGVKHESRRESGTAYRLNERRYGSFERSFPLPDDVNREGLSASFTDGVLNVTLPKDGRAAKRSQVQIRGG